MIRLYDIPHYESFKRGNKMKWKRWSIGCVAALLLLIVSTCFWKTIFYLILSTFGGVTTYRQIGITEVS